MDKWEPVNTFYLNFYKIFENFLYGGLLNEAFDEAERITAEGSKLFQCYCLY